MQNSEGESSPILVCIKHFQNFNPSSLCCPAGMKTPLSPTQLIENGQLCFAIPGCVEVKDPIDSNIDMQLQQEKKKLLYSLCEVCNIQLHSAAQSQVHYNGKSHLKRVKQLNNGELPSGSVSTAPAPLHSLSSSSSQGKTSVTQKRESHDALRWHAFLCRRKQLWW